MAVVGGAIASARVRDDGRAQVEADAVRGSRGARVGVVVIWVVARVDYEAAVVVVVVFMVGCGQQAGGFFVIAVPVTVRA
jgi:hypothetical protein